VSDTNLTLSNLALTETVPPVERLPAFLCWLIWVALSLALWGLVLSPFFG
jgi:hypothetical protein